MVNLVTVPLHGPKYISCTYVTKQDVTKKDGKLTFVNIYSLKGWLWGGFPRDGTSRGTSREHPGKDEPLSLCPGTKKFPCPAVPLSRDKSSRKNPGTRSSVPGRPVGQNGQKNGQKMAKKIFF